MDLMMTYAIMINGTTRLILVCLMKGVLLDLYCFKRVILLTVKKNLDLSKGNSMIDRF